MIKCMKEGISFYDLGITLQRVKSLSVACTKSDNSFMNQV